MNILKDRVKTLYFKYLVAASGSAMVVSVFGMIDAMMVGQYHGPMGTAALAVFSPMWSIIYCLGLLAGIGSSVLFANLRGRGEEEEAQRAKEKAEREADNRPDNLRFLIGNAENLSFLIGNAENLTEWLPAHSVDCLYLNFSDPWPKAGHKKRRLTHRIFLERYQTVLKKGGVLRFKTDNVGLFDFSLEEFETMGLTILEMTRDLHHSPMNEGNIMTEYERNFSEKGFPIHAVTVKF